MLTEKLWKITERRSLPLNGKGGAIGVAVNLLQFVRQPYIIEGLSSYLIQWNTRFNGFRRMKRTYDYLTRLSKRGHW